MLDLHQAKIRRDSENLSNNGPPCNIQADLSEMPGVGNQMWTATVDFKKAFDSISHRSIWDALKSCNVNNGYIRLLMKIYRDQKASVMIDEESNIFDIQKGSKQGDPLSSCCSTRSFNTL